MCSSLSFNNRLTSSLDDEAKNFASCILHQSVPLANPTASVAISQLEIPQMRAEKQEKALVGTSEGIANSKTTWPLILSSPIPLIT